MNPRRARGDQQDVSRYVTRGAQIFVDLLVLSIAFWLAFLLRFEIAIELKWLKLGFFTWPYVVVFQYLVMVLFQVPSFSWRYVGVREATRILMAVGTAAVVLVGVRMIAPEIGGYARYVTVPMGVLLMDFVLAFLGVAGVRLIRRMTAERKERRARRDKTVEQKRTLLIGAGRAGVLVAREVMQNPGLGLKIVGFVDDDAMKIGTMIHGHKVLGDTASLGALAKKHQAEQAVISIAKASGSDIRRIVAECEKIDLSVKIIPGIYEILDGRVNLNRIRQVEIEDLLGREAVELDLDLIGAFVSGKRVLITGAGGSIGSEMCRQVCRFKPERLVLVEQAENALFYIHKELKAAFPALEIVPAIADVCDAERVEQIFDRHRPHVVFHAAAHKHVPMMEWNPGEAVKNNVFGTRQVADAADRHRAEAFVMVSTDKAVNPTSIMGATKRVAEIYCQSLSRRSATKYVAVRFGNVLGSAGSVIPIFKDQIKKGGPVTVTHPEMKRYFMTIPEACQLVMQSAAMGEGGEIFVLDMGEPVKIVDLARDLIRLSGFSEEEIAIEFTGVREGEKLFEELGTAGENMAKTRHPKVFIGKIAPREYDAVAEGLAFLSRVVGAPGRDEVEGALRTMVPEMGRPATDDDVPEIEAEAGEAGRAEETLH